MILLAALTSHCTTGGALEAGLAVPLRLILVRLLGLTESTSATLLPRARPSACLIMPVRRRPQELWKFSTLRLVPGPKYPSTDVL